MTKKKAVTIHDVAQRAGVAASTVSKFLNGMPYVSEKTKVKIQRAIDELAYEPNTVARSLVKQKTGYLGLLIPTITNPFYPDLVEAIEQSAAEKGYYLILANTDGSAEKEIRLARELGKSRVDGLIFSSVTNDSKQLNQLLGEGYKFAMASRHVEEVETDYAVIDGFAGAKMAVEHLLRLGHQKIGHIGGWQTIYQFRERYWGFQDTLGKNGIQENSDWVTFGETNIQGGYQSLLRIMQSPVKPTALFVGNDTMALGVLEACDHYKWKVPEDLAIVSFDNISYSRLSMVPLTTVDSRISELAQFSVQMLADRLQAKTYAPPRKIVLKPSLIIRKSCGS